MVEQWPSFSSASEKFIDNSPHNTSAAFLNFVFFRKHTKKKWITIQKLYNVTDDNTRGKKNWFALHNETCNNNVVEFKIISSRINVNLIIFYFWWFWHLFNIFFPPLFMFLRVSFSISMVNETSETYLSCQFNSTLCETRFARDYTARSLMIKYRLHTSSQWFKIHITWLPDNAFRGA